MAADKILIIGGTKGTGLALAQLLSEKGKQVTVTVRAQSDTSALEQLDVTQVIADAMDRANLDEVFSNETYDAVVTSLGGRAPSPEERADYHGNINAVEAAKAAGVKRFVMLGAIGTGDSIVALSDRAREILGPVLKVKTKAEDYLKQSGLDYTIIRGGALGDEPATGNGFLTEDESLIGTIQRADFAVLAAAALEDPDTLGKTYGAIDKDLIGKTFF